MDQVIPWQRLITLIQPHYAKPGRGRRPLGLEKMLRIYFLQHWFDLSDPAAEDAIYDSESMRRFVGVELGEDTIPDESTILRFRHLLEEHQLTKAIFEEIGSPSGREGPAAQAGDDRGCHNYRGAELHQKPLGTPRSGDAADPQRQHVALRDEGSRRYRQAGAGAFAHDHGRSAAGYQGAS
jgi:IS5 family transposase